MHAAVLADISNENVLKRDRGQKPVTGTTGRQMGPKNSLQCLAAARQNMCPPAPADGHNNSNENEAATPSGMAFTPLRATPELECCMMC